MTFQQNIGRNLTQVIYCLAPQKVSIQTAYCPLRKAHLAMLMMITKFNNLAIFQLYLIIIYSCCCRSAYAIDHAPTDAGGACKTSSQRTRARTTRDHTILITIQFLLPSLPYQ